MISRSVYEITLVHLELDWDKYVIFHFSLDLYMSNIENMTDLSTNCGRVMSYGIGDLGQHWFR